MLAAGGVVTEEPPRKGEWGFKAEQRLLVCCAMARSLPIKETCSECQTDALFARGVQHPGDGCL